MTRPPSRRLHVSLVLVLVAGAFAAYEGWLGWDHEYQRDVLTGQESGPYEAWQVLGCALTLSGLALGAGALRCRGLAVAVLPLAFTVAWSVPASQADGSGLWVVGAVLVLTGTLLGSAVLASVGGALRRHVGGA